MAQDQYVGQDRPQPHGDASNIFDPNNLTGNNLSLQQPTPTWGLPTYDLNNGWTFPTVPNGGGFGGGVPGGFGGLGGGAGSAAPLPATAVPSVASPITTAAGGTVPAATLPSTAVPSIAAPITTAAGGTLPTAAGSSMPGWLKAIGGVPTLTSLAGAGISAYTANRAANQQAAAAQAALDFAKQQWATTQQNLSPYMSMGAGATKNLRFLLGIPDAPAATASPAGSQFAHTAPPGTPSQGTAIPRAGTGFVTMKAPDGTIAQVDPSHVARATQLGGTVVGQ